VTTAQLTRPQRRLLPAVAVGGALGSLARWGVAELWPSGSGFPWPVLVVNVVGCALMGLLMAAIFTIWEGTRYHRHFVGVGFLGGFTTFSTYALDTLDLLRHGSALATMAYAVGSVAVCFLAVGLGLALGRVLWGRGVG